MKLGAMISSGKDGWLAAYLMDKEGHDIACIITIESANKSSYMFHTPNTALVSLQAEAIGKPLVTQKTPGEKEIELEDLKEALRKAKELHNLDGIITGALYSNYQRERIEKIAEGLGLKVFSPLWHMGQEDELRLLFKENFKIIFSSVAADGLDKSWLGRIITEEDIDKLVKLNETIGMNVAGEGGEFESLVLDCPLFSKQLDVIDSEIVEEDKHTAQLIIKKAILKEK